MKEKIKAFIEATDNLIYELNQIVSCPVDEETVYKYKLTKSYLREFLKEEENNQPKIGDLRWVAVQGTNSGMRVLQQYTEYQRDGEPVRYWDIVPDCVVTYDKN